jgi:hypothetical protein
MKNEFIVILVLLMKSMGAHADAGTLTRTSDIPTEIQHCLVLAAQPEDRSLLKMALDQDCYNQLTDDEKQSVLKTLKNLGQTNFSSTPMFSSKF